MKGGYDFYYKVDDQGSLTDLLQVNPETFNLNYLSKFKARSNWVKTDEGTFKKIDEFTFQKGDFTIMKLAYRRFNRDDNI